MLSETILSAESRFMPVFVGVVPGIRFQICNQLGRPGNAVWVRLRCGCAGLHTNALLEKTPRHFKGGYTGVLLPDKTRNMGPFWIFRLHRCHCLPNRAL